MQFWTFYRMFRRWKWVIIALGVIIPLIIVVATVLKPDTYVARSVLYPSREASIENTMAGTRIEAVRPIDPKIVLGNLMQILRSRGVWDKGDLSREFGVEYSTYAQRLGVEVSPDSDLMTVTWEDNDPERAVGVVNGAVTAFATFYENLQSEDAQHTREVLDQQKLAASDTLEKAERALEEFQSENQLLDDRDVAALQTEYARLQAQERDLAAAAARAGTLAASLEAKASALPERTEGMTETRPNPELERLRQQRVDAQAQLAQSEAKYNPVHPKVVELKDTISDLTASIRAAEAREPGGSSTVNNPVYQEVATRAAAARAEADGSDSQLVACRGEMRQAETRLLQLPGQNQKLVQLTRDREVASEAYQRMSQALEEAKVNEEAARQKGRIRVIEQAEGPLVRQSKQLTLKAVLGLVAALFLSVVFILLLEQLDNRIKGPADVERLIDLRTIGAVPLLMPEHNGDQPLPPEEAEAERIRVEGFHEAFRALRSQVFLLGGDPPPRAIGVVSARNAEGRTTVALNLAESIAQAGESVVLVDANLRVPAVHAMYGLPTEPGLANVLRGELPVESALRDADVPGLKVLPAGSPPEDPAMLLGSAALRGLVGSLRQSYGWVIVDTPPGLAFVDAVLTAAELDGVLMVVAAGEIARGAQTRIMGDFEAVGTPILGAVVNKVLPQYSDALYFYQQSAELKARQAQIASASGSAATQ